MVNRRFAALGVVCAMSLTACGGSKAPATTTTAAPTTVAETTTAAETTAEETTAAELDMNVAKSDALGMTLTYAGKEVNVVFVESDDMEMEADEMPDPDTVYVAADPTGLSSLLLYGAAGDLYGDDLMCGTAEVEEAVESEVQESAAESEKAEEETDESVAESEEGEEVVSDDSANNAHFTSLEWYGARDDVEDSKLGSDWVVCRMELDNDPTVGMVLVMADMGNSNVMVIASKDTNFQYEGMTLEYDGATLTLDMSEPIDNSEFMKNALLEFSSQFGGFTGMTEGTSPDMEDGVVSCPGTSGEVRKFKYEDVMEGGYSASAFGGSVSVEFEKSTFTFNAGEPDKANLVESTDFEIPFGKLYRQGEAYVLDSEDGYYIDMSGEDLSETLTAMMEAAK